jgi:hypothetical protein
LALPTLRGEDILTAGKLLEQVLDDMLAAVLVAGTLTALLSYFAPEPNSEAVVEVVAAKDRGARLSRAQTKTRKWWFSGAMGRYTRAETLPTIAAACREDGRSRSVVLQLIDPRNHDLCQRYASLRRSLRESERAPWSVAHVQKEVVATIVTAYAIAAEQSLLDLRVALRPTLNQQRFDLSDLEVIITTEDERREALSFPAGSHFYDIVRDELRLSFEQSHLLPGASSVGANEMGLDDLRSLLATTGLDEITFAEADLEEILSSVRHPRNPYG